MRELDPRYVLPSRKSVSKKHIVDTYNRTKNDIRNSLAKSRTHAVTTDMWTSSSNTSYMGVTAHWIDDQFVQHNRCLEVKPAPGSHTADFLSSELTAVMDEWNIDPKHVHIVTDSGANIRKAVTQMPDVKWRGCFAHKLQLCVNGALTSKEVTDLPKILAKARAVVGHFRRSPLATTQLNKAQDQLSLPRHKLLQDCPTRWNSQVLSFYNMSI